MVAEATFVNREEVPVHPIYRDPVSPHSFHFFFLLLQYLFFINNLAKLQAFLDEDLIFISGCV